MLDGMQDPAFLTESAPAYKSTRPVQVSDDLESLFPIEIGEELDPPAILVDADDVWLRRYTATWTDEQGVPHGPEEYAFAAIRVGAIVTSIDLMLTTADGESVASIDDFEALVQNLAQRAEVARHGP